MSSNPIKDMYEDAMTPQVRLKFDNIRTYMATQSNIICHNCGDEMSGTTGCYQCPGCGNKDCGE